MTKKNKGGRPRKGAAEKLKYKISVKLCTQDYYTLKANAESAGMKPAEFARTAINGCMIRPRLTPEEAGWIRQLSGMSNNLNQLARQANQSGFAEFKEAIRALAIEIFNIIKLIRNDGKNNKG